MVVDYNFVPMLFCRSGACAIVCARVADVEAVLKRFVTAARREYDAAIVVMESLERSVGPALTEAWCTARLSVSENGMDHAAPGD